MNSIKVLLPILNHSLYVRNYPKLCQSSVLEIFRKYSTQNPERDEVVVKEKIHLSKPTVTKWKRPPFVKEFFIGKFDTELLAFPEILNNEELEELEHTVKYINGIFTDKVDSRKIDENKKIPNDVLQDLKELGLFGRMIPAAYGGIGLTNTACIRINEVLGLDWSIASTLAAHEFLATQIILLAGTEDQKQKYLPDLASGNRIAAMCCAESKSGSDLLSMETYAEFNTDSSYYVLNGSKSWVSNAQLADYYLVFAKTKNPVDINQEEISIFLVDKNSEGVIVKPYEKTNLQGLDTAMVHFQEVAVPLNNVFGPVGTGYEIFWKVLDSFRFVLSSSTIGTLKFLLDSITEYVINTERVERSLGDVQLVRERLSKINTKIYVMESLSYFTAAILDSTENPDIALESAIVKVFNSEGTLFCLRELMNAFGSSSFIKGQQLERLYRDAQALANFEGSNDVARLCIGLTGCKYIGFKQAQEIMQMRNAFFFPKNTFKTLIRKFRVIQGWIKYDQDLAGHIHPSLVEPGNHLEEVIQKLEVAMQNMLTQHGSKVIETQMDPVKAANIAIDCYAMAAVLSRSSRSYCIGLKNSDQEVRIAITFCQDAYRRALDNLKNFFQGPAHNNDGNNLILGEQVIDCRGYFAEHPLKHNF